MGQRLRDESLQLKLTSMESRRLPPSPACSQDIAVSTFSLNSRLGSWRRVVRPGRSDLLV